MFLKLNAFNDNSQASGSRKWLSHGIYIASILEVIVREMYKLKQEHIFLWITFSTKEICNVKMVIVSNLKIVLLW